MQRLYKYLNIFSSLINGEITIDEFQTTFFDLRRHDDLWMSGKLNKEVAFELSRLFTATDAYSPEPDYEVGDISEQQLLHEIEKGYSYLIKLQHKF